MGTEKIKDAVKERYGKIANGGGSCCAPSCCPDTDLPVEVSRAIGYSDEEITAAPEGANLGLGCGNPTALAEIAPGDTVVDLGSGAGFDCFLAAGKVGPKGRVIGVDMTTEMIEKARANADKGGYGNVEFRLGEIEELPVADAAADVIISNCVINLSPDKPGVFSEAWRVLKNGGRLLVSDIVVSAPLPPAVLESVAAYVGCVAGAETEENYLSALRSAGFDDVTVLEKTPYPVDTEKALRALGIDYDEGLVEGLEGAVQSIKVRAVKKA